MDAVGSTFNVLLYTDDHGYYKSNPVGNAQLIVSKYKTCLADNADAFRSKRLYSVSTRRDQISEDVLEWAAYGT